MEKLYIVGKDKTWSWLAQIMSSLLKNLGLNWGKKGKSLGHSGYDLNQIPYKYTVEVMNRFKGLDLVDRAPEEL